MGPPELCGACQWLVGFLELSRSKMEECPKPGPRSPRAANTRGSRGLARPLLAKSKGAEIGSGGWASSHPGREGWGV